MAAAPTPPAVLRCRGLRVWCARRCEATLTLAPPGWPLAGAYCALHAWQRPKTGPDGALIFESPAVEEHVRRRTSFVGPEAGVAGEMVRAPGLVKDRPGAPRSASGAQVVDFLVSRRGLDEAGALAYAQRMLDFEHLQVSARGRTGAGVQSRVTLSHSAPD
jgi:hypothetical protein